MRLRSTDNFGAVARRRRRRLGISQAEVASRAGVTRQWLVRFEQGNADVSLSKAFSVLSELGLIVRADEPSTAETPEFRIPQIDLTQLDMAALRKSLNAVNTSNDRTEAEVRDGLKRMNAIDREHEASDD